MQAIQRLQALGFSQHRAAEAFMVCGKNEEMAANFLFENAFDDEQQNMEAAIAQSMGMANAE